MRRIVSGKFRMVRSERGSLLLYTYCPYVLAYVDEFQFGKGYRFKIMALWRGCVIIHTTPKNLNYKVSTLYSGILPPSPLPLR